MRSQPIYINISERKGKKKSDLLQIEMVVVFNFLQDAMGSNPMKLQSQAHACGGTRKLRFWKILGMVGGGARI